MTYQTGSLIEARDFNLFLTGTEDGNEIDHQVANLSCLLGTGYGKYGYGQTVSLVPKDYGDAVTALDWTTLMDQIKQIGVHQKTTLLPMTGTISNKFYPVPATGIRVQALPNILDNLELLFENSLNASSSGQTITYPVTYQAQWKRQVTFSFVVSFESSDKARYFFNRGGRFQIFASYPVLGTGDTLNINRLISNLCAGMGTLVLSSPVGDDTVTIGNSAFTGLTRIGANLPVAETFLQNKGWYSLSNQSEICFNLLGLNLVSAQRLPGYNSSSVQVSMFTNGPQGLNGDNGSQLTIKVTMVEQTDSGKPSIITSAGLSTSLQVVYPATRTYFENSWGSIDVASSVVGS